MTSIPARTFRLSLGTVLCTALAGGIALAASADIITVCPNGSCDFTDPVAAVNAAVAGDIVEIAAGTYPLASAISIYGKNLTVRGAVDAAGRPATILDGQGVRSLISGLSITDQTRFENLVIANGRSDYGGGVFLSGASPVFANCRFVNNAAVWQGGAMFLSTVSRPTLIGCELGGNSAGNTQSPSQGAAGAVSIGNGTLTLIDCAVSGNSSTQYGGAFLLTSSGTLVLESTRVCGNTAVIGAQIHLNGGGGTVNEDAGSCISNDCDDCAKATPCPTDLDLDGMVNAADLGFLLMNWGSCKSCSADIDGDGTVGSQDLATILAAWGPCAN
jgi:hypothetical protein